MKYNKICKNKPWQKMHISMDPEMNIHDVEITDCYTADIEMLESLIPENISVDRVIADGVNSGRKMIQIFNMQRLKIDTVS